MARLAKIKPKKIYISGVFGRDVNFIQQKKKNAWRPRPCEYSVRMTSLKRVAESKSTNLSSTVFVRTLRNGKVQKVVRELYLRQDIPCSSKLCSICLANIPTDSNGKGW